MTAVREAAVAGLFYPTDAEALEATVRGLLDEVEGGGTGVRALIVPHAGYVYSGPIAASGYACVQDRFDRVVLVGPAHRYPLQGAATHSADFFATPLGRVPIERTDLAVVDAAHAGEHSLEVHLPFLQLRLGEFRLVPILIGAATPAEVAAVLEPLWQGAKTLLVISSDLSHFHDYDTAVRIDARTADAIVGLRPEEVGPQEACGCRAIGGLLLLAQRLGLHVRAVDLRNSGDTAGDRRRVVGYGAFVVEKEQIATGPGAAPVRAP